MAFLSVGFWRIFEVQFDDKIVENPTTGWQEKSKNPRRMAGVP